MADLKLGRAKQINRVKKIRGQLDTVERTLAEDRECADVLLLLAAARGGINSLMAEVLEDHVRLHLQDGVRRELTPELGEELIDLIRAYLK